MVCGRDELLEGWGEYLRTRKCRLSQRCDSVVKQLTMKRTASIFSFSLLPSVVSVVTTALIPAVRPNFNHVR